jgi:DeoR/GlpR family transcriptional regulator of sugar metabolism
MTIFKDKITIRELSDELNVTKQTVRNYLVKAGIDVANQKKDGVVMLDKESADFVRTIYHQFTGK